MARSARASRRPWWTTSAAGIAIASPLLLSFAAPDDDAPAATETVQLRPTIKKKWDFLVPNERWRPIDGEIQIGGFYFATEVKSDSKLLVATKPGTTPRLSASYKGDVVRLTAETSTGEEFETAVRIRGNRQGAFSWAPAGLREGEIAGEPVWIIDANANGVFDDLGQDAVVIGRTPGAATLGSVWLVDGELYEVEVNADGTELTYAPYRGEVGVLDVTSEFGMRANLVSAVFESSGVSLQLADTSKGVTVPAGDYTLSWGRVEKGKDTADIVRGEMPTIEVEPGATTVLEWGHEIHGKPEVRRGPSSVTINPGYRIWGGAGEEYVNFSPAPEAHKFRVEDEKGKKLDSGSLKGGENVSAGASSGGG